MKMESYPLIIKNHKDALIKFLRNRYNPEFDVNKLIDSSRTYKEFISNIESSLVHLKQSEKRYDYHSKIFIKMVKNYALKNKKYFNRKKMSILDYGCNTGDIILNIAKGLDITKVYGVDIIDMKERKDFNFILIDPDETKIDLGDNTIDIVILSMVLHHVKHIEVLSEIYRILKKGGIVIIREHDSPNQLYSSFLDLVHRLYYVMGKIELSEDLYYSQYYTIKQMDIYMKKYGFQLEVLSKSNNYNRMYYAIYKK